MEINFFNPRSVVLFVCLLQGLIFAALLFRRAHRENSRADRWLGVLLILLCLNLITPFIGFANVYDLNQWLTYFPFAIAYSFGVVVYLYVLSLTDAQRRFARRDLFLFAPSLIYVVFRLSLFAQNLEWKARFDDNYYVPLVGPFISVTEFIWNSSFLLLAIRHYRRYRAWLDENFSDTERIKFDWLRNFLYIFTLLFVLGGIFDFTDSFVFSLSYVQYFYFEIVLALATYYLALAGYLRSETIELNFAPAAPEIANEQNAATAPVTARRTETPGEFEKLKIELENLMTAEKPYLEPQLTLAELASRAKISPNLLSAVINQKFGKNFNDFINAYRIEAVKNKLAGGAPKNLNLLGVAFECGFNSKATFNRTFKKQLGLSPKEYLAEISGERL